MKTIQTILEEFIGKWRRSFYSEVFCPHTYKSDFMITNGGFSSDYYFGYWAAFCDSCGKKISDPYSFYKEIELEKNYNGETLKII